MKLTVTTMTFSQFAQIYMDLHAKPHKRTWKLDASRLRLYLIPEWGTLPLDQISQERVARLHAAVGAKYPYQANRMLENIITMFELAIKWGYLPSNFVNPGKSVRAFRERDRMRFLNQEEAERLLFAIQPESDSVRTAILLLLLTGLRKKEILSLRWEHVNFRDGWIKVTDKNGEIIFQPISKPARAVLMSTSRLENNPFVIVGQKRGCSRNTITKAWTRIRKRANLQDVNIHDLRRTVGAWLTISGHPLQVVKEVLNHKDIKSTLVYAKVPSKQKTQALDEHGGQLLQLVNSVPQ